MSADYRTAKERRKEEDRTVANKKGMQRLSVIAGKIALSEYNNNEEGVAK